MFYVGIFLKNTAFYVWFDSLQSQNFEITKQRYEGL